MKYLYALILSATCAIAADLQTINVGSLPNDGTGDPLRNAMVKVNTNVTELARRISSLSNSVTSASVTGTNSAAWRAALLLDAPISVKWFGATGNGSTDDTASIQSALDAMAGGGELNFPKGVYRISDTLLSFSTNLTIRAKGAILRSGWDTPTDDPMLYVGGRNLTIDGLCVDGLGANSLGIGIIGTAGSITRSIVIQNCELLNCARAEWAHGAIKIGAYTDASSIEDVTVRNCWIHENVNTSGVVSYANDGLSVTGLKVLNNRFKSNNGKDIIVDRNSTDWIIDGNLCEANNGAIHVEGASYGVIVNNTIKDCSVPPQLSDTLGVPGHGILIFDSHHIRVANNRIEGVPANRINIWMLNQPDTTLAPGNVTVTGNHIEGGQYGVSSEYGTNIVLTGNTILTPGRNGIYFNNVARSVVSGNCVIGSNTETNSGANGAAVYLSGATYTTVMANTFTDTRGVVHMTYGVAEQFGCIGNTIAANTVYGVTTANVLNESAFTMLNWNGSTAGDLGTSSNGFSKVFGSSFGFTGYPDTGLELWGANDLALSTAGIKRVRVNASGMIPTDPYPLGGATNRWGTAYLTGADVENGVSAAILIAREAITLGEAFYLVPPDGGTTHQLLTLEDGGQFQWRDDLILNGYLRLPNNTWAYGRNAGDTNNVAMIGVDAADRVNIAPGGATTIIGGPLKMGATSLVSTNITVGAATFSITNGVIISVTQ